ncbi:lipopolysaccharide biosynthesis protein [Janibacter hoylei]|uniref:lipopolysaccharide biosynthesis protein n=1 Tax=Janibacter hoylei TaxID=364298 RepID=UPI00368080F0
MVPGRRTPATVGRVARAVAVVVGGTAGGQLITLAASPALTRIYDPAEFGQFTLFVSVATVIGVVAGLRLELAVPVVDEADVVAVVKAGMLVALAVGLGLLVAAALSAPHGAVFGLEPAAQYWLALAVSGLACTALLSQLAVRRREYSRYATRKLVQALAVVAIQVAVGYLFLGGVGLIVGYAVGQVIVVLTLLRGSGVGRSPVSLIRGSLSTIRKHRRYAVILAPSGLLNTVGTQIPVFLILAMYGPVVGGFYGLAQRVLAAPVGLVGTSIAQVYLGELSTSFRESPGSVLPAFRRTSRLLWGTALVLGGIVVLVSPTLFSVVFGERWNESGHYAQALAVGIMGQLAAVPMSQTLVVADMLKSQLAWDSVRVVGASAAVAVPASLGWSPLSMMYVLGIVQVLVYVLLWFMCRRAAAVVAQRVRVPGGVAA